MRRCLLAALLLISQLHFAAPHARVLAYGDSLTAGFYKGGRQFHPYAPRLSELLGGCTVDWLGLSGWTTAEMRATLSGEEAAAAAAASHTPLHVSDGFGRAWLTLAEALEKKPPYTHVVILGGTNDLATALLAAHHELPGQGSSEAEVGAHYAIASLAHLKVLHEAVHSVGAATVAVTVPEVLYEREESKPREMRLELNRGLKLLAASYAEGVVSVADAAEALPQLNISKAERAARWDDGLHFTPAGYDELAAVIAGAIKAGCGEVQGAVAQGRALKRTQALLTSQRTDVTEV